MRLSRFSQQNITIMSKTIIIDNYDSFTYNLVQIVNEIQDEEVTVRRNNETTIEEVATFDHIILSPGPGLPEEAGLLKDIIKELGRPDKIIHYGEFKRLVYSNLNLIIHIKDNAITGYSKYFSY